MVKDLESKSYFSNVKRASIVWDLVLPDLAEKVNLSLPICNLLVSLADCLDDLQFVKFGITFWASWEDRNKIHFGEALTTMEYKSECFIEHG